MASRIEDRISREFKSLKRHKEGLKREALRTGQPVDPSIVVDITERTLDAVAGYRATQRRRRLAALA